MLNHFKKLFTSKKDTSVYTCSSCGKQHDNWPAIGYNEPHYYSALSNEEKTTIAQLSSDFCEIQYPDETSRFIRATLDLFVDDNCEDLNYGLWVSLSEKSFDDYKANFNNPNYEGVYFGWISNTLEGYKDSLSIPTDVKCRTGGSRPEVIPHHDFDHPLVRDYYNGISKAVAQQRINDIINNNS
ncbi:DUF2199 domain-containing protein [Flavobacterium subsaxonicum]|uniref:DUF2199 domain-containing protein n=1 Tax=Flavobacterium subsaxonicum WB 4.1-42 = DSM 21790 TaxID=1121898 RepID=A0A0A2MIG0_9FLAO|nr:DUF2199 domain-containing protein [Flavobacterium subsaxonicum]KGO92432.1 hypothetical protein Q766_13320 [Flavobacterium subsaxonicum WB 4.1-42 = DSM 21790]